MYMLGIRVKCRRRWKKGPKGPH